MPVSRRQHSDLTTFGFSFNGFSHCIRCFPSPGFHLLINKKEPLSPEIWSTGFEAGALTHYLADGLQAVELEVICPEARLISAARSAIRNNTDNNGARARYYVPVRADRYSRVHVKSMGRIRSYPCLQSEKPDAPCRRLLRAASREFR